MALLSLTALCLYLLLSLVTYSPLDDGWSTAGANNSFNNAGGPVGAYLADGLLHALGYLAYIIPLLAAGKVVQIFRTHQPQTSGAIWLLRLLGFFLSIFSLAALIELSVFTASELPAGAGGMIGQSLTAVIVSLFSTIGGAILLTLLLCIGSMLFWEFSWLAVFDAIGRFILNTSKQFSLFCQRLRLKMKSSAVKRKELNMEKLSLKQRVEPNLQGQHHSRPQVRAIAAPVVEAAAQPKTESTVLEPIKSALKASGIIPKLIKEVKIEPLERRESKPSERAVRDLQGKLFSEENPLPSIALLDPADENQDLGYSKERLEELSVLLEMKLADFGIKAEVMAVAPGPVITRFEIQPAPGTKASKVSGIAQDLARSMAMNSVRVVEVIPGKSVMGIEIPNEHRAMVRLSSVLSSEDFDKSKSPLTIALGHDIAGNPVVTDLAKMPHLLVAGTTGSGKSVGVNAMIISLLYKSTPDEVRLIMVDPKMLELSVYEGIPHLLTPVITDMKEAANGLRWCVEEMERRYQLMAAMGVRNVAGHNAKVKAAIAEGKPIPDPLWRIDQSFDTTPPTLEPLPYIVVIVDEFADMMMTVGKKVEELIARIAQKARAAGIHLILATQRPSVDVITGLIKANVPTRIAFQVSSKIDSRTILDQGGAEQLLGHGDMLFQPAGTSIPIRVHGAFVDDDEVHRVVAEWKTKGEPNYIEEITQVTEQAGLTLEGGDEKDDLYDQAVEFITETRKASISSVQRKFRIGYNRAARLVETMEASGVVSPPAHNGSREVIAPPPINR
ncbi:MAG: DNA translocase FtsK 4TM domain-containing protein [Oleispira antarctica]|nr:DNA translocase FtsK 4TM domain-containing protein [Oleispira antarctica]MBQ0792549.1 DNA translocase FtsK 4TM domain-containing protein [Oleispira antarctica]